jgi:hypothetical protein
MSEGLFQTVLFEGVMVDKHSTEGDYYRRKADRFDH